MSTDLQSVDSYGGYETAEQSLAARSKDLRTVAQVVRAGGELPESEIEKLAPTIDYFMKKMADEPKLKTLRATKNLLVIARAIDERRRRDIETKHKMELERAKLDLEAERNDLIKVGLAIRANQARIPVNIFGTTAGAPIETDNEDSEFDRMLGAVESVDEFEAIERVLNRMPE